MPTVDPSVLANSIMGKLYDVLTNGDDTVPKSENSFFSWETPGVPVTPEDFRFLTQGFTGVVTPEAVKTLLAAEAPAAAPAPQPVGAGAATGSVARRPGQASSPGRRRPVPGGGKLRPPGRLRARRAQHQQQARAQGRAERRGRALGRLFVLPDDESGRRKQDFGRRAGQDRPFPLAAHRHDREDRPDLWRQGAGDRAQPPGARLQSEDG